MIRTLLKPLSFIPALLLMYMIFSFSSQTGEVSSQLSYKVSHKIVETVDYVFDGNLEDWEIDDWANRINFITRKLAHMTEYFALAVAVAFPLYVYGLHGIWLMLVAGIICVGFACGDEYHQAFVAGRSPSRRDVLIDSFGVFWGIVLVRIVGWTGRKTIFRPKKKKKESYIQEEYYHEPKRSFFGRKKKAPMDYSASYRPEDYGPQGFGPQYGSGVPYHTPEQPYGSRNPYNAEPYFGPSPYAEPTKPEKEHGFFKKKKQPEPDYPPYPENGPYPTQEEQPPYYRQAEDSYWRPPEPDGVTPSSTEEKKEEKDWFFDDLY